MGKVYLTGSGPGDAGLITVRGLEAIKKADCIIYDRLVGKNLLQYARKDCELIYAGKENHRHTMPQEEMNQLLVEKALEYERVVRLKGGDVYVFGRGGEEGIYLRKNQIPFEVIPGISSSMAGLAYAGIPVTHRGMAGGFYVVTAHDKRDELADIDFKALAATENTCVFLMGLSKLSEIVERLMAEGKRKDAKAAVISHGTTPEQRTVTGTLVDIEEKTRQAGITSPALIVVGEVVSLRSQLNFFEERPLFGRRYLLPRAGDKASALTERLLELGAGVWELPVGRIIGFPEHMEGFIPEYYDYVILTSKNGVENFAQGLFQYKIDFRRLGNIKFAVVGKATAEYLESYGIYPDMVPESYDSDRLFEKLRLILRNTDRVFYGKAEQGGEEFLERLSNICRVEGMTLYRNEAAEQEYAWEGIEKERFDGIIFTCSSSVERTMKQREIKKLLKESGKILSIGEKTGKTLLQKGITDYIMAREATYEALVDICLELEEKGKE